MRRVVITGAGALTPHGDLAATLKAVEECVLPAETQRFIPAEWGRRLAAVPEFDARSFFRAPKAAKVSDRRTRMLVAAASMALADAGLDIAPDPDRAAVIVGTSGSDLQAEQLGRAVGEAASGDIAHFATNILSALNPLWLLVNLPNMAGGHLSIQFGFKGPNNTIMSDWMAGLQAIGEGCDLIRAGEADVVLAGGGETSLLPFALAALSDAGFLDEGFLPSEGAALVVLEHEERARARGARILGEIAGYSCSAESVEESLRDCAMQAGRGRPLVIRGAGTRRQADQEAAAIAAVMGGDATVEDFRWCTGHPLAAAGAIDLAVAAARARRPEETVFCNSFGHSGQCTTVAFRSHEV